MSEQRLFDLLIIGHHSSSTHEALAQSILKLLDDHDPKLALRLTEGLARKGEKILFRERIEVHDAISLQKGLSLLLVKSEIRQPTETDKPKANLETTKQSKVEEAMRLRESARRQLDAVPTADKFLKVIAGMTVAIILLASLGLVYYLNDSPSASSPQPAPTSMRIGAAGSGGKPDPGSAVEEAIKASTAQVEPVATIETAQSKQSSEQVAKLDKAQPATDKVQASQLFQVPNLKLIKALVAIDEVQQLQPQLGAASGVFRSDRENLQEALKRKEAEVATTLIESTTKPYSRSLLLLELAQWHAEQQQATEARDAVERIRKALAETRDIDQQVLILGALSKGYLVLNDTAKAEASLKQAITKASDVPKRSFQVLSLMQLANEQALLGNVPTTQKLLKLIEPLLGGPATDNTKAAKLSQVVAIYALVTDFEAAKSRLAKIEDHAKRASLTALINDLEARATD